MSKIEEIKTDEKRPEPKCVVFDEHNNVQMAESAKTILVFLMGDEGVKVALNGYVTETLLKTLKDNMPKIMDNLMADFKKEAEKVMESKKENATPPNAPEKKEKND